MRRQPTYRLCFGGKFQIAEIAVRGTSIRNKNRVVKVEYHRHARPFDEPLKDGRAKQRCFAKNVNRVKMLNGPDERQPSGESARNVRELSPHVSGLIQQSVQIFVFEWSVSDLDPTLAQQRFPLLNSETLTRRRVVHAGHYGKKTHICCWEFVGKSDSRVSI